MRLDACAMRCGILAAQMSLPPGRPKEGEVPLGGTARSAKGALITRRIAIVEDEPAIRANYAEALRRHGYEVATYADRAEALTAFRTRLPDLALVDIGLGDDVDGGFALTLELRALSATVPII